MIFFGRSSSSTAFSIWQPKNARQTLGDKLVCISNLQHYQIKAYDKLLCWDRASFLFRALFALEVPPRALGKHASEAVHKLHSQLRWRWLLRCTAQTIWAKP